MTPSTSVSPAVATSDTIRTTRREWVMSAVCQPCAAAQTLSSSLESLRYVPDISFTGIAIGC